MHRLRLRLLIPQRLADAARERLNAGMDNSTTNFNNAPERSDERETNP